MAPVNDAPTLASAGAGTVVTDFVNGFDGGLSVALQSNGKIVVSGFAINGTTADFALARYNANGTLDTSFNNTGKATTDFFNSGDVGYSVAVQSDDKIVVAGVVNNGATPDFADFALARYNADGTLDTNFGGAGTGKLTTDFFNGEDRISSVALQSDGKIVVSGMAVSATSIDFALARYDANGTLDTTFGSAGTGKLTTEFTNLSEGLSVALQSDDKIVVSGFAHDGTSLVFALARYNANGSLDTSFNGTGTATTDFFNGRDLGRSVALQSDGKIVVSGSAFNGTTNEFALARYNVDGTLDISFNGTGKLTTDFYIGGDEGYSVALQSDGKIVVSGLAATETGGVDFALARYNVDGTLDTSFNGTGKLTTDFFNGTDGGVAVAVQSDGKIVVSGSATNGPVNANTNSLFALARYNTDGSLDESFGGSAGHYTAGTHTLTEDAGAPNLVTRGSMAFDDADLTDTHTLFVFPIADRLGSTITANITTSAAGTEVGNVDWTYSIANSATQHLAEWQMLNESFAITVRDGHGGETQQTVEVTVNGVNDAPSGASDAITIDEDTAHTLRATDFGFTDVDTADGLSAVRIDSTPAAGLLTLSGAAVSGGQVVYAAQLAAGSLTFKPIPDANGTNYASLTFSVADQANTFDPTPKTLAVNVTAVNDSPMAVGDPLSSIAEDSGARTISFASLLSNDSTGPANESGQQLTITGITNVVGGTAMINGTNIEFTPTLDLNGPASFDYTVRDDGQTAGLDNFKADTGSVSFNVTAVNDAPVASDDVLSSIAEDSGTRSISFASLLSNDSTGPANESGQQLTITALSNVVGGTAVINGTNIEFTPTLNFNGLASFDYIVRDNGQTNGADNFKTDIGNVSFNVTEVNDSPVAVDDPLSSIAEDSGTRTISFASLLTNDSTGPANEAGQQLTITGVFNVLGGTTVVNGTNIEFTPTPDFNGPASFDYTVRDNGKTADLDDFKSDTGSVSFNVTAVNDAPVAANDTLAASQDTSVTYTALQLLGNDTDVDSSTLQIFSVASGANGSAVRNPDGTVTFTPIANFFGTASFSYVATDGALNSNSASVTVNVAQASGVPPGTPGPDTINGTAGNDILSGLGGNDTLRGGDGDDILDGGTGADILDGGAGIDTASYANASAGSGNSGVVVTLLLGTGLAGEAAGDQLRNVENLTGSSFNDFMTGDGSSNVLDGGAGNDTLFGLGGNDTLLGGAGVDTLSGGDGNDILVGDLEQIRLRVGQAMTPSALAVRS